MSPEQCDQPNSGSRETLEAASQHRASGRTSGALSILTPADVAKEEKFVLPYRSVFGVGLMLEPLFVSLLPPPGCLPRSHYDRHTCTPLF